MMCRCLWCRRLDPTGTCRIIRESKKSSSAADSVAEFQGRRRLPPATPMTDLHRWLDDLGLGHYAELLAANNIDAEVPPSLDDDDLARLGIPSDDRKKLIEALARHRGAPIQAG